jgi:hypothetical protein
MRLFRQTQGGVWGDVIERIASRLCAYAAIRESDQYGDPAQT